MDIINKFECVINCNEYKKPKTKKFTIVKDGHWKGIKYDGKGLRGIVCNEMNNVNVLDIDVKKETDVNLIDGLEYLKDKKIDFMKWDTLIIQSPSGGIHVYFSYKSDVFNNRANIVKGVKIDWRGEGKGYICFGDNYKILKEPTNGKLCEIPFEILNLKVEELVKETVIIKQSKKDKKILNYEFPTETTMENQKIKEMISKLDAKRAEPYDEWIQVGFVCKNLCPNQADTFKLDFKKFSQKCSSKFDDAQFETDWSKIHYTKDGLKIGTLLSWVADDDIAYFSKYISKKENTFFQEGGLTYEKILNYKINKNINFVDFCFFIKDTLRFCYNNGKPFWYAKFENGCDTTDDLLVGYHSLENNIILKLKKDIWHFSINFQPSKTPVNILPDNSINTFRKFPIEKHRPFFDESKANLDVFLDHIKQIICKGEDDRFEYISKWLACIIQKPEHKNEVALVFSSEEGAGKNVIFDAIGKYIFGSMYQYLGDFDSLFGRFNESQKDILFTVMDECKTFSGSHKENDKLKGVITRKVFNLEGKGKAIINNYNDFNNYIFFSNNEFTHKTTHKDRRSAIFAVSNAKIGDTAYFDNLVKFCNIDTCLMFFDYLNELDLSGFNVRKIPMTVERAENIRLSCPKEVLFLKHYLDTSIDSWFGEIKSSELFEEYKKFIEHFENGFGLITQMMFSLKLKKLGIEKKKKRMFHVFNLQKEALREISARYGLEEVEVNEWVNR